jgi:hypothetical protein
VILTLKLRWKLSRTLNSEMITLPRVVLTLAVCFLDRPRCSSTEPITTLQKLGHSRRTADLSLIVCVKEQPLNHPSEAVS